MPSTVAAAVTKDCGAVLRSEGWLVESAGCRPAIGMPRRSVCSLRSDGRSEGGRWELAPQDIVDRASCSTGRSSAASDIMSGPESGSEGGSGISAISVISRFCCSSARHCSLNGCPNVWFSGLLSTASDADDSNGESERRCIEFARERTNSRDDSEAAPMECIKDCARERADSEREVPEFVRERESDREPGPDLDREPLDRRCELFPRWRILASDVLGLGPGDSKPTLSCCSASSTEPSASGTSIRDWS